MSVDITNVFHDKDQQLKYLKSKRAMMFNLAQAIEKYLCFDLDLAIDRFENPKFTPEMLVDAMAEVGRWEKRLEFSRNQLIKLSDAQLKGESQPDLQEMVDTIQEFSIEPAEHNLEHAKDWLVKVQEGLDRQKDVEATNL